jgi:hypothetical protein
MNVVVHPKLCLGEEAFAADVAGVLPPHVVALDMILQRVLGFEHAAAAGAVVGRLAVLVVHVSLCKKK